MNKDEALKMAIREMTNAIPHLDIHFDDYFEAINACKEALKEEWQGLSEEEIDKIGWVDYPTLEDCIEIYKEIEQKLKEKNT